jgi:FlaA1/EpsC-like NDP-sugar epimerase
LYEGSSVATHPHFLDLRGCFDANNSFYRDFGGHHRGLRVPASIETRWDVRFPEETFKVLNRRARTLHGIRPQVRAVLMILDLVTFLAAAFLAENVIQAEPVTRSSIVTLALTLYFASVLADARGETARTFDLHDITRMVTGAALGGLFAFAFEAIPSPIAHVSGRVVFLVAIMGFVLRILLRIAVVSVRRWLYGRRSGAKRTLLVGAGRAALSLSRVIRENRTLPFEVVGCVDDGVSGRYVEELRVLGKTQDLWRLIEAKRIECVIIAIPSVSPAFSNEIAAVCSQATGAGRKPPIVKVYPGVSDVLNEEVRVSLVRDVKLEDLLQREPVRADLRAARTILRDRTVLVTGAGGSIGSELCRQIATLEPRVLLLLGHGENSLFAIQEELNGKLGFERTKLLVADVANLPAIRHVFSNYRPDYVFHAAAHKHVPIVEANVCESLRNNVLGTHNVALAAAASGASKFILLSTDKAVNPTSVMGATKRLAELICQSFGHRSRTDFVAVRFGNVLGSRGSVLPTFRRQLESGGPLTITHRDMERYFMTIPEAVTLVLEATVIGQDGQVLVLDMGRPVKILTLAETVITLAGFEPYRDIAIVETGIRPGEKLYEELLTSQEGISRTGHERLFIAQQERVDYARLAVGLQRLERAIRRFDAAEALDIVCDFVPSFTGRGERSPRVGSVAERVPSSQPRPLDIPALLPPRADSTDLRPRQANSPPSELIAG